MKDDLKDFVKVGEEIELVPQAKIKTDVRERLAHVRELMENRRFEEVIVELRQIFGELVGPDFSAQELDMMVESLTTAGKRLAKVAEKKYEGSNQLKLLRAKYNAMEAKELDRRYEIRADFIRAERALIREALQVDWLLTRTAKRLGTQLGSLQKALKGRHPKLWEEAHKNGRGKRGRPRNK